MKSTKHSVIALSLVNLKAHNHQET